MAVMLAAVVVFTAAFSACVFGYIFIFNRLLSIKERPLAPNLASYISAGIHGLVASGWALQLLYGSDWTNFEAANTQAQDLAMTFSMGYFLADTFAYLIPFEPELVFFLHHIITVMFLACALHLGKGANACLFGILLGEVTNPAFHLYNALDALRPTRAWARAGFRVWAPVFTAFFVAVRSLAGPVLACWWCAKVVAMAAPLPHKTCWIVTAVGITGVSQLFTRDFIIKTRALLAEGAVTAPQHPAAKQL